MNGKQDEGPKGSVHDLKQPVEEALNELKPFIQPGKEEEAGVVLEAYFESHRGPLPSARELRNYDLVLPGAAERILAMAESEQQHRHGLETQIVGSEASLRGRGQWFALASLIASLVVVALFAAWGAAGPGAWLGGAIIVSVVGGFLGQRLIKRRMGQDDETPVDRPQAQTNTKGGVRAVQDTKSAHKSGRRR